MGTKKNAGQILAAWLEMTTALRHLEEVGIRMFAGAAVGVLDEEASELEADAAGEAVEEIVALVAKVNDGDRPVGSTLADSLKQVRVILDLMRWPGEASHYALEIAKDQIEEGLFPEAFGESTPPLGIPDLPFCHGCPDEKVAGTEPDPRGFPGLLCESCAAGARLDVAGGHAELGPDASPEARAKALEVATAYEKIKGIK